MSKKNQEISNRLESLRKSHGIKSQKKLASVLGLEENRVQRIESGTYEPYASEVLAYSNYFEKSESWIIRGREWKPRKVSNVKDFVEIMENLLEIMKNEKRRDIIDGLRGLVKDLAERRGVEEVVKKMTREKYTK